MTKYLTNSEMAQFRRCKRKWWLGTYRGLRRRTDVDFNKPTGIGNRVHDALAYYYDPLAGSADAMSYFEAGVSRDLDANPTYIEEITKEADLSRKMLEGYFQWLSETGADQALTVIEAERALTARLEPGPDAARDTMLLTKLDARVSHDEYGSRMALEHKTVGSLKQHLPELRLNTQCLTEHLTEFLAQMEAGASPEEARSDGVLFNMLLKSKRTARATPPFYSRTFVTHSLAELRNHWRHVVAVADEIATAEGMLDAGADHHLVCPPTPTSDCHWSCPFFRVCPNVDGDADHESQIEQEYERRDPLERYDGLLPEVT